MIAEIGNYIFKTQKLFNTAEHDSKISACMYAVTIYFFTFSISKELYIFF